MKILHPGKRLRQLRKFKIMRGKQSLRARSPVRDAFFVGYANGYYAYFPTIKAAVEGGYGANSLTTRTEVGAGEAMLDHAIVKLFQMQGKLKSMPSP